MKLKIGVILIAVLASLFFLPVKVFAADLTVVCYSTNTCTVTPGGQAALFFEKNILPGHSITKKITATNNTPDGCNFILDTKNETDPGNLAPTFFTVIKNGPNDVYGVRSGANAASSNKYLSDVFSAGSISLGTVLQGATKTYDWTITMNPLTGNEYKGKETKFDFDMNFSCGVPPSPSNPSNPSNPSGGGNECNDSAPGVPTNFGAVLGANSGEINLSWTAPAPPYNYFLVAYSDGSDWPPKWGNPSVGNVTSYTVSGLGSGTYWFWVRAGNGCKPGAFAGPVTIGSVAGVAGAQIAQGFEPGVLGATPSAEIETEIPEVMGEAVATCVQCFWWPLLIIQAILIILRRRKVTWSIVVSVLVFLAFWYINRNCPLTGICRYFWLLDLGVLLILRFILTLARKSP